MNSTIARLTATGLLRGWRGLLLALLPFVMLALALLVRMAFGIDPEITSGLLDTFNLDTVVPLIALIVGTGAIATEIDDGAIVYLLTKPVARGRIIVTKLLVAITVTLLFAAVPTLIAAIVVTGAAGTVTWAYTVAATVSGIVYCAVFLLLGVLSRRAVIIGLMYVMLWEMLVTGLVDGARALSIQHWGQSIAAELAPDAITASLSLPVATTLAVLVTGMAAWFATQRLRSLTLAGDS
ncbi:ABC-2 type transport system permease protein [Stackebrandtia albiflava]|uniref:ABC-2 type transport system permease protein n=1 Tax=Stackebrandtia albiflava TaxID=406432 RepID=A0A562UY42_9ACTN|nr:ABC transporter permease subunit [Stackebrandtia albiflava]TWJ10551.1 ABC-2 type transport system permease protein [Stackebrandtia albiflava]